MKRILLKLAVSVLTFALGLTVSAGWRFYTSVNAPEPFLADISGELPYPLITLQEISISCGSHASYYYGLSNGGYVTSSCQDFSSDSEAHNVFHARYRDSGIIEWSTNRDNNEQAIGESVLVVEGATVRRLSTYRASLCEIQASSLEDLRWFENEEFHLDY
jgi:hypothetical protein